MWIGRITEGIVMTYSPSSIENRGINAVEVAGIKQLIKDWCGLDIHLIEGGPSITDPCGIIDKYISFRDKNGNNAVAFGITDGRIVSIYCNQDGNNGKKPMWEVKQL